VKLSVIFLLLVSPLFSCNSLNNQSQFNRVDCGETVSEDHFYVLDSKKNRLAQADFQILMRSGQSQTPRIISSTSKGCFSKDVLTQNDILLVKSPTLNEAQVIRPEQINGRTPVILQTLTDKKPSITCNFNLVDSKLFLNQFIDFNDANFLEFYDISASISSASQLVAQAEQRPLLNAGTYDLRSLIRGQIYQLDFQIHDFVYSNGSLSSTPCELDMDIPNLSAKLGDEIKEFRNYFGETYGVVDEDYELNFYIEGGLKTVSIDYCLVRLDPEEPLKLQDDASCADLGLPVKSYVNTEKGERFDKGFWLVLYRYKKGLLTKPWVAQKIMVRKVCKTALYKTEELDQNFCTDIEGNINAEGLEFKGSLEVKYASVLLGQLYVGYTNYQSIHFPNLEFASQIDIEYNDILERIRMPRLSQVSLNLDIADNTALHDIKDFSTLERVGNLLNIVNTDLQSMAGLENLKAVGGDMNVINNPLLSDLAQLQSLALIGGGFRVDGNETLKKIDGLDKLAIIGRNIRIASNVLLEKIDFNLDPDLKSSIDIVDNPKLVSLKGFENTRVLEGLALIGNEKLSSFESFRNVVTINTGLVISNSRAVRNFEGFERLKTIKATFFIENLPGLTSFKGLNNLVQLSTLSIANNYSLIDLKGLEKLESLNTLGITDNVNLETINGLSSLSNIDQGLSIIGNTNLKTLTGSSMRSKQINSVSVIGNPRLKDLAILSSLETSESMAIRYNSAVLSLNDLKNLKNINSVLEIVNNNGLENLEGLNLLTTVGKNLILDSNLALKNLNGLSSLTNIGGNLDILSCTRLKNLQGLEALQTVKGRVTLRSNLQLQSLEGLAGLESVGEGFLFQFSDALKNPCSFFANPEKVSCRF